MLNALAQGVKGGVWFSLIDKVFQPANLRLSYHKVAANRGAAGVDHVTVEAFGEHLEAEIEKLRRLWRLEQFKPQAIRRVYIDKPGSSEQRPLGIPTVRDRVVQTAIRHVIEPIFEKEFAPHSYGFRPQRGCKDALRRVEELLRAGKGYVVDVDLKGYFDSIPHDRLMGRLRERIADGALLSLIESYLKSRILEGPEEFEPTSGTPQGATLSPLLSNIYRVALDHRMADGGWQMVRYADDMVILCGSRSEAEQALAALSQWCKAEGLELHPKKTRIVDIREEGFDFLGYLFETQRRRGKLTRWPSTKSLGKLRATLRKKTRRTNGTSLLSILADVNETLVGWFGYFQHSYPTTFAGLDSWIRGRLRSLLRKRRGGRGRGRGSDHQRWPNSYFAERGYYSLVAAHARIVQSPCG